MENDQKNRPEYKMTNAANYRAHKKAQEEGQDLRSAYLETDTFMCGHYPLKDPQTKNLKRVLPTDRVV